MDDLIKINDEVYYVSQNFGGVNEDHYAFLRKKAKANQRKRCRICTHKNQDAVLHEMFILHTKGNYVPPHAHSNSDESLTLLKGQGVMFYFDVSGKVTHKIKLHHDPLKGSNYLRTPKGILHSLYITSNEFLFKEVVLGPFDRNNMIESLFAPNEDEIESIAIFMENCQQQIIGL